MIERNPTPRRVSRLTRWRRYAKIARRAAWACVTLNGEELVRQRRRLALRLLEDEADRITFERNGTIWTTAVTGLVGRRLFVQDQYQLEDVKALIAWLESHGGGDHHRNVVIDLGANIGTTTLPFAQAGYRVLAVEPAPANFELLQQNVRRNGLEDRVTCVHAAISRAGDTVEFLIDPAGDVKCEVKVEGEQGYKRFDPRSYVERVPAAELDRLVTDHGFSPEEVTLVWSDTQGCEGDVVESGASLIAAGVPFYLELWPEGLDAHGGRDRFVQVATRSFGAMIPRQDLRRGEAATLPLSELAPLLDRFDGDFSDALFLPR